MTKPDRLADDVERAHLRNPCENFYSIDRFQPAADLTDLIRRHWVPRWRMPAGVSSTQEVLQYPVCLIVVAPGYSRFYGVQLGLSATTLRGHGWACGVMLQPAAGRLLLGQDVTAVTDRHIDLDEVFGPGVTTGVRDAMTDPDDAACRRAAASVLEQHLREALPIDDEGRLVNAVVAAVEDDSQLTRVEDLARRFQLSERALQRLTRRRLGLHPKWLIQRRRLHEASGRLRDGPGALAQVAADLGYADQAHFSRDFSRVCGMTPGDFARRFG